MTHGFRLPRDFYTLQNELNENVKKYNGINMAILRSTFCPLPSLKQIEQYSFTYAKSLSQRKNTLNASIKEAI